MLLLYQAEKEVYTQREVDIILVRICLQEEKLYETGYPQRALKNNSSSGKGNWRNLVQ